MIKKIEEIKKDFLENYEKLTPNERIVVVMYFNGQPYTWNPVWLEVTQNTDIGEEMLEQWRFYQTLLQESNKETYNKGFMKGVYLPYAFL